MNAGRLTHEECKEDIYKVHDIVRRKKRGKSICTKKCDWKEVSVNGFNW
jgi:hypothetical protein